jgi:MYND finger
VETSLTVTNLRLNKRPCSRMVKKRKDSEKERSIALKESADKNVKDLCGFTELSCRCCGRRNEEIGGFLLQCATCRKAHYCSKECFNNDLEKHMEFCQTNELLQNAPEPQTVQMKPSELQPTTTSEATREIVHYSGTQPAQPNRDSGSETNDITSKPENVQNTFSSVDGVKKDDKDYDFVRTGSASQTKSICEKRKKPKSSSDNSKRDSKVLGRHCRKDTHHQIIDDDSNACMIDTTTRVDSNTSTGENLGEVKCRDGPTISNDCAFQKPIRSESSSTVEIFREGSINDWNSCISDLTDTESCSQGKIRCCDRPHSSSDYAFQKPTRSESSTSLEAQNEGSLSDSNNGFSDMTDSVDGFLRTRKDNAGQVLCCDRPASSNDCAMQKPNRTDSSSSLEGRIISFHERYDATQFNAANRKLRLIRENEDPSPSMLENGSDKDNRIPFADTDTSETVFSCRDQTQLSLDVATKKPNRMKDYVDKSDSSSDASVDMGGLNTSEKRFPNVLRRRQGINVRRHRVENEDKFSDDRSTDGFISDDEICDEEMRMKKRLTKLWSLPEVTAKETTIVNRGRLQLSKSMSMLREKGRMHRCLGNLWKLSSASSTEKTRNTATFDEWSDIEDSDNEEIRRRHGGGSVELISQIARRKQEFTTTNISLRTPELPGPKDVGWERPTWTACQ